MSGQGSSSGEHDQPPPGNAVVAPGASRHLGRSTRRPARCHRAHRTPGRRPAPRGRLSHRRRGRTGGRLPARVRSDDAAAAGCGLGGRRALGLRTAVAVEGLNPPPSPPWPSSPGSCRHAGGCGSVRSPMWRRSRDGPHAAPNVMCSSPPRSPAARTRPSASDTAATTSSMRARPMCSRTGWSRNNAAGTLSRAPGATEWTVYALDRIDDIQPLGTCFPAPEPPSDAAAFVAGILARWSWRYRVRAQAHTSADFVRELVGSSVATVIEPALAQRPDERAGTLAARPISRTRSSRLCGLTSKISRPGSAARG